MISELVFQELKMRFLRICQRMMVYGSAFFTGNITAHQRKVSAAVVNHSTAHYQQTYHHLLFSKIGHRDGYGTTALKDLSWPPECKDISTYLGHQVSRQSGF